MSKQLNIDTSIWVGKRPNMERIEPADAVALLQSDNTDAHGKRILPYVLVEAGTPIPADVLAQVADMLSAKEDYVEANLRAYVPDHATPYHTERGTYSHMLWLERALRGRHQLTLTLP